VGTQTAKDIGLEQPASFSTRALFALLKTAAMGLDSIGRLFSRRFSISRLITRVLGYHLLSKLLLSQTRPLALPDRVLDDLHQTISLWANDPKAAEWLNRLEDVFTVKGPWHLRPTSSEKIPVVK
jgi:hypothetical protein